MQPGKAKSVGASIDAAVRGKLGRAQTMRLRKDNPDVFTLALLAAGRRIAEPEGRKNGRKPSPSTPSGTRRLTKPLRTHAEHIFTLLDYADVPFENNFAKRQIRAAVILRTNSQSNRSDRSAATQAILTSVYRTLKLRGLNPTKTIAHALRTYLTTGKLTPLPSETIGHG